LRRQEAEASVRETFFVSTSAGHILQRKLYFYETDLEDIGTRPLNGRKHQAKNVLPVAKEVKTSGAKSVE
jgi:hypothetical protein